MRRIIFTNGLGEDIVLDDSPFHISKISGFGTVDTEIQTQKAPYQDGATFIGSLLNIRDMSIEGAFTEREGEKIYLRRRALTRAFNPKLGPGTLRFEYAAGVKEITAVADGPPAYPDKGRDLYQRFLIDLRAPDPAWKDPDQLKWTLASFVGGLSLPFSFPISFGTVGQSLVIDNQGDLDAPVFLTFKGPLTNPVLENVTTGKKISITKMLDQGEILEINTAFGQKEVTFIAADGTRTNGFGYVDPDSEFWQMIPGENNISYAATEEAGDAAVTLLFYTRYVGV